MARAEKALFVSISGGQQWCARVPEGERGHERSAQCVCHGDEPRAPSGARAVAATRRIHRKRKAASEPAEVQDLKIMLLVLVHVCMVIDNIVQQTIPRARHRSRRKRPRTGRADRRRLWLSSAPAVARVASRAAAGVSAGSAARERTPLRAARHGPATGAPVLACDQWRSQETLQAVALHQQL